MLFAQRFLRSPSLAALGACCLLLLHALLRWPATTVGRRCRRRSLPLLHLELWAGSVTLEETAVQEKVVGKALLRELWRKNNVGPSDQLTSQLKA